MAVSSKGKGRADESFTSTLSSSTITLQNDNQVLDQSPDELSGYSTLRDSEVASIGRDSQDTSVLKESDDEILFSNATTSKSLFQLDPGPLGLPSYANASSSRGRLVKRDPVLAAEQALLKQGGPAAPLAPTDPSLSKKALKELRKASAKPAWADLPTPSATERVALHREVEALRLRNQLDPKRFYRKDEGEGKGVKGLPAQFAIGTILPSPSAFGGPSADNLPRTARKRTIVDELVDDAEARRYAKKKFLELQSVKGSRGRGTLARKLAPRKPKW